MCTSHSHARLQGYDRGMSEGKEKRKFALALRFTLGRAPRLLGNEYQLLRFRCCTTETCIITHLCENIRWAGMRPDS